MDIFNRKRVEELELEVRSLRDVKRENDELKELLAEAERDLADVVKTKETTPADCTPGPYCGACEFVKKYYFHHYGYFNNHDSIITGKVCGKGELCKNFVHKEIKEK